MSRQRAHCGVRRGLSRVLRGLKWRLWEAPRGCGRPCTPAAFDGAYARGGAWGDFDDEAEAPRYQRLRQIVVARPRPPRLLDAGCGSGRLAVVVGPHAVEEYLGIDISAEGLARAEALKLPWARFELRDVEAWWPEGRWDLIVFNESMGYLRDPAAILARWADSLSPDGAIVVSQYRTGNYRAMWRRLRRALCVVEEATVTGPRGHVWDIRLLRPRR